MTDWTTEQILDEITTLIVGFEVWANGETDAIMKEAYMGISDSLARIYQEVGKKLL